MKKYAYRQQPRMLCAALTTAGAHEAPAVGTEQAVLPAAPSGSTSPSTQPTTAGSYASSAEQQEQCPANDGRALLFYPKIMRAENGRFIVQSTLITAQNHPIPTFFSSFLFAISPKPPIFACHMQAI